MDDDGSTVVDVETADTRVPSGREAEMHNLKEINVAETDVTEDMQEKNLSRCQLFRCQGRDSWCETPINSHSGQFFSRVRRYLVLLDWTWVLMKVNHLVIVRQSDAAFV